MTWMWGVDDWIIILGVLAALACAIPGTFLLLRGMSMMGDAISHAVLPGIAIGFLISGSRDSVWMFVGAAVAGIVAAVLTQFLHRFGRLDRGASMGVVFTTFFALGLILIVYTADHVELDPECVLYGAIELAPIDLLSIAGIEVPRSLPVLVVIGLLNLILMILLYKEFKICSFDPAMARASGINVQLMNQILMIMTAATCVACFEVVGSILVVALLVVPAATARLLSDRLNIVLILAMVIGSIGAALGHLAAISIPGWFPIDVPDTSTAGMIAVMTGVIFVVALAFSPRHGLIPRGFHRLRLRIRIASEDALGLFYRSTESQQEMTPWKIRQVLVSLTDANAWIAWLAMRQVRRNGLIAIEGDRWILTVEGHRRASELIRSHRLWEAWLWQYADLAADHVHGQAMRLEHITDQVMRDELAAQTDAADVDPHGRRIPSVDSSQESKPEVD